MPITRNATARAPPNLYAVQLHPQLPAQAARFQGHQRQCLPTAPNEGGLNAAAFGKSFGRRVLLRIRFRFIHAFALPLEEKVDQVPANA